MRIINIDGIIIKIRKNSRARNINITIKPMEGVFITVPKYISYKEGEKVALEKIEWIRLHSEKMSELEKTISKFDETSDFQTRNHKLKIVSHKGTRIKVSVNKGIISVKYPVTKNVNSLEVQKAARKGIDIAIRKEAKEYLPKRLNELSQKFRLVYKSVFIKKLKSRWGSCSHRNNINLNMYLMNLPDHLIDYVLSHELVHTIIKNHSKRFWVYLDGFIKNAKKLDKELKNHRITFI